MYAIPKTTANEPYTLITFIRFCVSSHQSMAHGLINPMIRKSTQVRERNKMNSWK